MNNDKKDMEAPKIINLNDDQYLIRKSIEGDELAFRNLLQKHKEKVRNIIYLTLGNVNSVNDISQDVFITVYKNLKNFRFDSLFTTWLYKITINKCKDHIRKNKIRSIFSQLKEDEKDDIAYTSNEINEIPDLVQKAIYKLPEKLRTPLLLKDIQGMSYQEIAQVTESELGTVKSRIFRGREHLKTLLAPYAKELML